MREDLRSEWLARAALTVAALLPYWPLLSFSTLVVTDDGFASDIWNGELPGRLFAAAPDASAATWTNALCSGTALGGYEPLSLLVFGTLPPAAALDLLLVSWLLVAAHGTYALARRSGASRPAAVLAGNAFAASGYVVTQLKHLSIVGTVAWLPCALLCLDHALGPAPPPPQSPPRRLAWLALFGSVFALQTLQSFPQSAYICALVYGGYALYCVARRDGDLGAARFARARLLLPAALAALLGAAGGAASLWPLWILGQHSDRAGGVALSFAVAYAYEPRNALMFLFPYAFGDASDMTYTGESVFWEDYGYVGALTFLLAIYAAVRARGDSRARFWLGAGVLAYLIVLGPATPLFGALHAVVPGFGLFRLPTRFMVVVDLALCLLAALGLTRLAEDLAPRLVRRGLARFTPVVAHVAWVITAVDLFVHHERQNAFVDAARWLEPPRTARVLRAQPGTPRVFSPFARDMHRAAYGAARGWADLRPFYELRGLLQPNSNVYWGIASADCYSGIAPRWHVDVWGDHSRESVLVYRTLRPSPAAMEIEASPHFATLMRAYGVTHVVSSMPIRALEPRLDPESEHDTMRIYGIEGAARARVVGRARRVPDDRAATAALLDPRFDPAREVVLSEAAVGASSQAGSQVADAATGTATILRDEGGLVSLRTTATASGFLVLADTYYPGWTATVDGEPAEILRANLSVRAVAIPSGTHRVDFRFTAPGRAGGRAVSVASGAGLLVMLAAGLRRRRA